ncbi:MAG: class I SAM-dependent methyltransferase [Flavobacteriales bacterium]|nr:class I SAM-dependent methyltransferase [Flavobacteriales bacterium]
MGNHIKEFWDNQAKTHKEHHIASWGDNFAIDLEIETIGQHISQGDKVLDVGCANGFATIEQLETRKPKHITGIDFSEHMIEYALKEKSRRELNDEIHFEVGDITNIKFEDGIFDVVYTTRVVINLPTWQQQIKGIEECLRVTKKGGKVILSEGFWEPLILLNSMRSLVNLPPLYEHDFNRYLKKTRLEALLKEKELEYSCNDFSSIYYLGSRLLRELVTDVNNYEGYSNPINEIFHGIEKKFSGGGFGIQQAYIISK